MTRTTIRGSANALFAAILSGAILSTGCGDDSSPSPGDHADSTTDGAQPTHWLDLDPGTGTGVRDSRDQAPIEQAIVTGRVSDLVQGFQAFKITDEALAYCGEESPEDGCETPWDYCCLAADEVRANTILVELLDEAGDPIAGNVDDLRLLDVVSVRGQLEKDDHGNVTLVARGLFRKDRPEVGDHVRWP